MADPNGYLKKERASFKYRPVCERVKDFCEVVMIGSQEHSLEQTTRCMDCGTPFCHWACPVGNLIPEWNNLVSSGNWKKAFELLQANSNFPEITGRLCPALCESSCVLGVNDSPVTNRENELAIIERAFKEGLIKARPQAERTGKNIAVVGSGPSGLACADQLNKAGHKVTVFERDDKVGGIIRYGIPDFKIEKWIIDRRVKILEEEGIEFRTSVEVGRDIPAKKLKEEFDAVCLAGGSRIPRDLPIDGRDLKGIHFAMDYLIQSNRRVMGEEIPQDELIEAKGKNVVIIGGGDTGADCIGVANRQGAACVVQIEVLPKPPETRTEQQPWPKYPFLLKTSSSHEEGGERHWSIGTKKFIGENGQVKKLLCIKLDWPMENGRPFMKEIQGTEFEIEADLVILAIGFVHPQHEGMLDELGVEYDERGNVKTDQDHMTSIKGVFSAGDMHRGQSLIVWAVSEGRRSAYFIDRYLMGGSSLPLI